MFEEEDEEETESNLDMPEDSSDEELAGPLEVSMKWCVCGGEAVYMEEDDTWYWAFCITSK